MSADPIGVLRKDPTGVRRTFGHRANTKAWPPAATATANAAATMREASADYYSWFETPPPCEGRRHIQAVHRPEPAASEPAASRPVSLASLAGASSRACSHLQVLEIALVAHEHHHDRRVRVRAQLLEPPLHILKRQPLRDVVHQERTDRAAVVRRGDGAVAFLASCARGQRGGAEDELSQACAQAPLARPPHCPAEPRQRRTSGSGSSSGSAPVSQICALMILPSCEMLRVANSTPIVDLESRWNSFRVNRLSRLDLPTPESPMITTAQQEHSWSAGTSTQATRRRRAARTFEEVVVVVIRPRCSA